MSVYAPPHEQLIEEAITAFWETFPSSWHAVKAHIHDTAIHRFDTTVEQIHILRHVHRGVDSISDLAEKKGISRPAISQAVDVLVNKGQLTRRQSSEDRRVVLLALTSEGEAMLKGVFDDNHQWMKSKLAQLSVEELKDVVQALGILQKIFRK